MSARSCWTELCVVVAQSRPILGNPVDWSPPGSSVEFSGQEYWRRQPFPSPGDPPDPGIEPRSPALQGNFLPSEPPGNHYIYVCVSLYIYVYIYTDIYIYMYVCVYRNHCCYCLVTKSCPTLCDPRDCSPLGSSVHGISQARTLEWVVISIVESYCDPILELSSIPLKYILNILLYH